MRDRPPEDPFAPLLRGIVGMVVLILVVLWLVAGCSTAPLEAQAPAAKPAFPADMRIVCYQGAYWLGSIDADQVVRLPLSCT